MHLKLLTLFLAFGFSLFMACSCNKSAKTKNFTRNNQILFQNPNNQAKFYIEVADSYSKRQKGLMYRESLPFDWGMLFVFDHERDLTFWMKNTFIPLDLIFMDQNFSVVGVIENTKPQSLESLKVDHPAKYVLEINAGLAKKWEITLNTKAQLVYNDGHDSSN